MRKTKFLVVVDDTPEVRVALRYASRRARNVQGQLVLLRVIAPIDFHQWAGVADLMRQEAREAAEKLLGDLADSLERESGIRPELVIREGVAQAELLAQIEADPGIRILVLAAAPGKEGPGPLVSAMAGKLAGTMAVPITIVPGSLSDAALDALS